MSRFLLSFGLFICLCVPAMAGNLFPPANIGSNPNVACPNNQTLRWTGDSLECADPSPGVSISNCPTGQMLIGINKGSAVCSTTSATVTIPNCPAGQALVGITNGAPQCQVIGQTTATATTPPATTPTAPASGTTCGHVQIDECDNYKVTSSSNCLGAPVWKMSSSKFGKPHPVVACPTGYTPQLTQKTTCFFAADQEPFNPRLSDRYIQLHVCVKN